MLYTDSLLASFHHLTVFALFALLVMELTLASGSFNAATLVRLAKIDLAYGMVAGAVLIAGFTRVFYGAKSADFYLHNPLFWAKVGLFVLIGSLSILPTIRFIQWRKRQQADAGFIPASGDWRLVKRIIHMELGLLLLLPVLAVLIARGVGLPPAD